MYIFNFNHYIYFHPELILQHRSINMRREPGLDQSESKSDRFGVDQIIAMNFSLVSRTKQNTKWRQCN